jgi:hypothetical protein
MKGSPDRDPVGSRQVRRCEDRLILEEGAGEALLVEFAGVACRREILGFRHGNVSACLGHLTLERPE